MKRRHLTIGVLGVLLGLGIVVALSVWRSQPDPDTGQQRETPTTRGEKRPPHDPVLVGTGDPSHEEPIAQPPSTPSGETGSVVVMMVDASGSRVEDSRQEIYLYWRARGSREDWMREGRPDCSTQRGEGRIDDVPLGKDVQVRVVDPTYFTKSFEARGPARPGEVATIEVPVGPRRPVLTGLLVDPEGAPLSAQSVRLRQRLEKFLPDGFAQGAVVQTDPDGRFQKTMAYEPANGVWLFLEKDTREVVWKASVQVPKDAEGVVDFGTIQLRPENELTWIASGRVVDEANDPLSAGVRVMAYAGAGGESVTLTRAPAKVQGDGRFLIRTGVRPLPAEFRVSAWMRGRVSVSVTVSRGAEDVVLVLRPGGRLRASFRIPEGIPGDRIVGYIQGPGSEHAHCPNQYGGQFGAGELAAGTYDIYVKIKNSSWELARVEGVVVPEGEEADDARIRDIPLDALVRPCRIRLVAPDGKSLAGRHVSVRTSDGARATFTVRKDGILTVVAPPRYETFDLSVHGVGDAHVAWRREDQTVKLRQ